MKTFNTPAYFAAKKKVAVLKDFYGHLAVFIVINTFIIAISANVLTKGFADLMEPEHYITLFFWGWGIVAHALYVFFTLHIKSGFIKKWEDRKIQEYLNKQETHRNEPN